MATPDPSAIQLRPSTPADDAAIRALLDVAGLPSVDTATGRQEFLVAVEGDAVVGCVGLEVAGRDALLRSFAVAPALRGTGLGRRLYEAMRARLGGRGLQTAYVLTTTIEAFCLRHGFERVDRSEVPAAIAASAEFRSLCPSSAACLRLPLARDPRGA